MKKVELLFIFESLFFWGCQSDQIQMKLNKIDSLVVAEQFDSANYLLNNYKAVDINNKTDIAHYNLLKVQIAYLVNKPLVSSDSLISSVISFYEQHVDHEKLTDAYYYKALGACKKKDYQQSILLYKKAEQHAKVSNNMRQQYKVAEGISFVNGRSAKFDLQLAYAKEALKLARSINNKKWIAYSYYRLGVAFSKMESEDSVLLAFSKIRPYLQYVGINDLPILLSSLGTSLKRSHPDIAKDYLLESLKYRELTATYIHLADIYFEEGNPDIAYSLWKKSLTTQDATPKDVAIRNIIEYDMERGKTDSICERINEIIAIRDSIDAKLKNDTIKDLQTRFDHEVEMREKDRAVIKWQWVAIALVILLLVGVIYYLVRKYQNRIQLQKYQMQIHDYMEQIRALSGKKDQEAEIDRLNKEIKKIMDEKSPRLAQGRILYDRVLANENMGKWRLDDVEKFIEYYTATNYRVVNRLQSIPRRDELTPHRLLYLILVEMKKTDQQICFIQGITKECLRVYRFRTQPIEKEETLEESDESL